jgi:hypothetical protein
MKFNVARTHPKKSSLGTAPNSGSQARKWKKKLMNTVTKITDKIYESRRANERGEEDGGSHILFSMTITQS